MKEADLFRQYAHEATRSSSKVTSQEEKDARMALATTWAQAALMKREGVRVELHSLAALPIIKGDTPCPLISL